MPSGPPPSRKTASLFLSTLILFSFCLFALWHDREYRLAAEIEKEQGKNRTVNPNKFSWDKVEGLIHPPTLTATSSPQCTPSKELVWRDCYVKRQCARLIVRLSFFILTARAIILVERKVPLNYSDPNGEKVIIALTRKASLIPRKSPLYQGPVLFNPGGPGGSGVDLVLQYGDMLGAILGPQFDIVGFDPRG